MADIEIKVPALGESESEATLISWLKKEGDFVEVDDVLAEIESDKITMEITALDAGQLKTVSRQVNDVVEPGEVIGVIDDSVHPPVAESAPETVPDAAPPPAGKQEHAKPEADEPAKGKEKKKAKDKPAGKVPARVVDAGRREERAPMSRLRQRIASRLKQAQNTAAMLTTFNEVNMQPVMDLRARYGEAFLAAHGVKLGFMSFFVRAVSHAVSEHPALNAYIEGDDIVYHNYVDVGVAVSTDKGLVVPVLRNAHMMGLADIESGIGDLARRARDGGLMPDDLTGATISITNGGIFGSMLSTPILNPPQSGILGMHAIRKRAVVEHDAVVIRPMMYLALSYDHRLIDGSEAVRFLVAVKDTLEYPGSLTLDL
jgi:2-oxoglutarate dehydrogenase E2 component (dihydrolipoamide succinyltransferase)